MMGGRYQAAPAALGGGTEGPGGGPGGGTGPASVPEAARALGISERAVRKRITAGTIAAEKVGPAWVVALPAGTGATEGAVPAAPAVPGAALGAVPGAVPGPALEAGAGGTDLAPLADLIERQSEEIQRLTAAATLWQERARHLEGRVLALAAGPTHGTDVTQIGVPGDFPPPSGGKGDGPPQASPAPRWRRWWRRLGG